jgi:hypothetical protein
MAAAAKDYEEKNLFIERLAILSKSEYHELFRIIKRANEPYSENTNGVFFNLNEIGKETFEKMNNYMNFCIENRNEQDERLKTMEALRHESLHTWTAAGAIHNDNSTGQRVPTSA